MHKKNSRYSNRAARVADQNSRDTLFRLMAFVLTMVLLSATLLLTACSVSTEPKSSEADSKNAETTLAESEKSSEDADSAKKEKKEDKKDEDKKSDQEASEDEEGLTDELDGTAPFVQVVPQEDGRVKFKNLKIDDWMAWLKEQDKPVLIDFWAAWCGPCRMSSPKIDELAAQKGDAVKVLKINVDYAPKEVLSKYTILGIPYFALMNQTTIEQSWTGFTPAFLDEMNQGIDKLAKQ